MAKKYIPSVPRRRLGRTNLFIPVIPIGSAGFGDSFGFVTDEEAIALMRRGFELGLNHIDTAPCYGTSRRKVGLFVSEMDRDDLVISSRVCCHGQNPAFTAEAAMEAVNDNLKELNTEYLDIALVHDPIDIEPVLAKGGTLEGLLRLKSEGVIKNIGIGCRPHAQLIRAIETGEFDMILSFNDYNLLRQTAAERVLPLAAKNDIGVLNGWSIVRGILTGRDVEEAAKEGRWNLESPDIPRAKAIRKWCQEQNINMLALTLQFCFKEERIHGNPLGSRSIEQLEASAAAVSEKLPEDIWERWEIFMKFQN